MNYGTKLKEYMSENKIEGEYLEFSQSCHSVSDAENATGASPGEVVKNVCFVDNEGNLIVAIVDGRKRASTTKIGEALNIERPRIATPDEILEKSGFPVGGVPSFGYDATRIIDEDILSKQTIYTSGGTSNSLVKINTKELLRASSAIVTKVAK